MVTHDFEHFWKEKDCCYQFVQFNKLFSRIRQWERISEIVKFVYNIWKISMAKVTDQFHLSTLISNGGPRNFQIFQVTLIIGTKWIKIHRVLKLLELKLFIPHGNSDSYWYFKMSMWSQWTIKSMVRISLTICKTCAETYINWVWNIANRTVSRRQC